SVVPIEYPGTTVSEQWDIVGPRNDEKRVGSRSRNAHPNRREKPQHQRAPPSPDSS
ncbi:hypothetical protein B296_00056717, partial [Ensete ventricosum]